MNSEPRDIDGKTLVAQLNDRWRIVDDGARWLLQRRDDQLGWINRSSGSLVFNLENLIRKYVVGEIDPAALAIVAALPVDYRLVLSARGEDPNRPKSKIIWRKPKRSTSTAAPEATPVVDMEARQRRIRRAGAAARARRVKQRAAAPAAAAPAPAPPPPPAPVALFVMPKHPSYIRRLAAQFIAWRSRQAARHVREMEHA